MRRSGLSLLLADPAHKRMGRVAHYSPVLAQRAHRTYRMFIKEGGARCMRAIGEQSGLLPCENGSKLGGTIGSGRSMRAVRDRSRPTLGRRYEQAWKEHEDGGPACFGERSNRMALSLLGSPTCSVLYFVRTELRTVLAIAFSDRIETAMQPLASRSQPHHLH